MSERSELEMSSVETQLLSLYTDRELLERELGTSDPDRLVQLVRGLEGRLATVEATAAALPRERANATRPGALLANDGGAWGAVLARTGGTSSADVAAYLDELEVRLIAAEALIAKQASIAARGQPAAAAPFVATPADMPFGDLVSGLRALATDLGQAFDRAELVFEGESCGARWSVRCANESPSAAR